MSRSIRPVLIAGAALAVVAVPQASTIAQSGTGVVQSISAKDKQQGDEAHPQLVSEFGGAMTGAQAQYVESVGKKIAVQSGLSNAQSDFTVTLLNSPVNNAFAIPGGYVYTTRQLVALMNNEAELAAVLGHEVGHVAARHAAKVDAVAAAASGLATDRAVAEVERDGVRRVQREAHAPAVTGALEAHRQPSSLGKFSSSVTPSGSLMNSCCSLNCGTSRCR